MILGMLKRFGLIAALLALSACTQEVAVQNLPEMTFRHLEPFNLRVVDLQFADNRVPAKLARGVREVGPTLPTPPAKALRRWADDRLQLAGTTDGTARFTILKASATRTELPTDRSIKGLFEKQVTEQYDAAVEATLEIFDNRGIRRAVATAEAHRSITVREDETVLSRRRILYELVEKMMGDFDRQMDANIRRSLTEWLL